MADRCPLCDRAECPTLTTPNDHGTDIGPRSECPRCVALDDCSAHAVNWRARALAAESMLSACCPAVPAEMLEDDSDPPPALVDLLRASTSEALALRARIVAADRLQAEESERAALLANFVNTIGARIGAREQGYGAQSIEAGEARYRAGIMKRLDELLAAEAIARHLDDAATDEEARECVERLGIDVTTWAAEVRAKVLAALGDNLPTKET